MILPHNYKNQVDSAVLHDLIVRHRKKRTKDLEDRLFCCFWEVSQIIRSYISNSGFKNLNEEDWTDIKMVAITHLFTKLPMYTATRKKVCFPFVYMVLINKMRDLVKLHSFTKYVYNGLTNIGARDYMSNISSNIKGFTRARTNIIPLKKFNKKK